MALRTLFACGLAVLCAVEGGAMAEDAYVPDMSKKLPSVIRYEAQPRREVKSEALQVEVRKVHGIPRLFVNGELTSAVTMIPDPRKPFDQAALSVADFSAAGVRIFSNLMWADPRYGNWWKGEGEYDFTVLDEMVQSILRVCPDALFFPRFRLEPQPWWRKSHGDEMTRDWEGRQIPFVCMASSEWVTLYERMMRDVIGYLERAPYANRIIGYHVAAGSGGEWMYPNWWMKGSPGDYSVASLREFRNFLRRRCNQDVSVLRKRLKQETATFETVQLPTPEERLCRDVLRKTSGTDWLCMEFARFETEAVNRNLKNATELARKLTGGKKLIGVFNGSSPRGMTLCGSMENYPNLILPSVDFTATPSVYYARNVGDAGSYQAPNTASNRLHGKLFFEEVDPRTWLYRNNLKLPYRLKNYKDTVNCLKRHFGNALIHDNDWWYFLLAGNHIFHHEGLMNEVRHMLEVERERLTLTAKREAEVAVFSSDESNYFTNGRKSSGGMRSHFYDQIIPRLGVSYDQYFLEDINHPELPDYKAYIFLNAFALTPELRKGILKRVRRAGRTALFFYGPDCIQGDDISAEAVSKLTGIRVEKAVSESELRLEGMGGAVRTTFAIVDPEAKILKRGKDGKALAGKKTIDGAISVYSLLPLNLKDLRTVMQEAGVHVYVQGEDVFGANDRYVMLHAKTAGRKTIVLCGWHRVREVFRDKAFSAPKTQITETFDTGETRIYRIERVPAGSEQLDFGCFRSSSGFPLNYRYRRPLDPSRRQHAPLLIVMHGYGPGDVRDKGLYLSGLFFREGKELFKDWNLLVPQCPSGYKWIDTGGDWSGRKYRFHPARGTESLEAVRELIRQVSAAWQVDPSRIFVGGCSMGGFATWELLARDPGFYAGGFPICGGTDVSTAPLGAKTSLRVYHGSDDPEVLPENSRQMVKALKDLKADVTYTEYPGVKHASWTPAAKDPSLYQWLKTHHK